MELQTYHTYKMRDFRFLCLRESDVIVWKRQVLSFRELVNNNFNMFLGKLSVLSSRD